MTLGPDLEPDVRLKRSQRQPVCCDVCTVLNNTTKSWIWVSCNGDWEVELRAYCRDCGEGAVCNQYWLKSIGQASFSRKNIQKVLEENIENCSRRCSWRMTNLEQEENWPEIEELPFYPTKGESHPMGWGWMSFKGREEYLWGMTELYPCYS